MPAWASDVGRTLMNNEDWPAGSRQCPACAAVKLDRPGLWAKGGKYSLTKCTKCTLEREWDDEYGRITKGATAISWTIERREGLEYLGPFTIYVDYHKRVARAHAYQYLHYSSNLLEDLNLDDRERVQALLQKLDASAQTVSGSPALRTVDASSSEVPPPLPSDIARLRKLPSYNPYAVDAEREVTRYSRPGAIFSGNFCRHRSSRRRT